jgi:uncharacterized protein (TIGR03435 family)
MGLIAASLGGSPGVRLDRPVVDQTGLIGRYDFTIEYTPDSNRPAAAGESAPFDAAGTTFLEAVQEQLGVRLAPTKGAVDVLVIDHVERPSEN